MNRPFVSCQVTSPGVASTANVAAKWFLPGVDSQMFDPFLTTSHIQAANTAEKDLDATVGRVACPNVYLFVTNWWFLKKHVKNETSACSVFLIITKRTESSTGGFTDSSSLEM